MLPVTYIKFIGDGRKCGLLPITKVMCFDVVRHLYNKDDVQQQRVIFAHITIGHFLHSDCDFQERKTLFLVPVGKLVHTYSVYRHLSRSLLYFRNKNRQLSATNFMSLW